MDPGTLYNQTGGGSSVCSLSAEGLTSAKVSDSGMGIPVSGAGSLMDSSAWDSAGEEPWCGINSYKSIVAGDGSNRSRMIGNFQTCFNPVQTELRALISDRLGFIHGEFDVDRKELTSSYTDYDPTLVPQFTRIDGSGRLLSASVNPAGNLVLCVPSNRWFIEASPAMNQASVISVLGGNAVASLARMVSVELAGDTVEVEVCGAPEGWETGESYRLISGYCQEEGQALSDNWGIVADVTNVGFNVTWNMTAVSIDGIDGFAGETTDWPFKPSMLNGRAVSLPGSVTSSFYVNETEVDFITGSITFIVEGDATSLIIPFDNIIIGARENSYLPGQNTQGAYAFCGDSSNYENVNRQLTREGIWSGPDPLGQDLLGNYYSYVANSPKNFIDPLGLGWYCCEECSPAGKKKNCKAKSAKATPWNKDGGGSSKAGKAVEKFAGQVIKRTEKLAKGALGKAASGLKMSQKLFSTAEGQLGFTIKIKVKWEECIKTGCYFIINLGPEWEWEDREAEYDCKPDYDWSAKKHGSPAGSNNPYDVWHGPWIFRYPDKFEKEIIKCKEKAEKAKCN